MRAEDLSPAGGERPEQGPRVRGRRRDARGARPSTTSTRPTSAGTESTLDRRATPPVPLTPDDGPVRRRYADGRLTRSGRWLICVEERIVDGDRAATRSVAVATDGSTERVDLLDESSDFVAAPRISPDGSRLAWIGWDHPSMPWDRSELRARRDRRERRGCRRSAR